VYKPQHGLYFHFCSFKHEEAFDFSHFLKHMRV
jgi:hypothetical protein